MREATKPEPRRVRRSTSQHAAMRRTNENTVLRLLRQEPDLPGTLIARKTGLAPQTVSVLLRNLESGGLIARSRVLRGKRGQPAVPFHLKDDAAYAIGVEVGWQQINFVLLDLAGTITHGRRIAYPHPSPDHLVSDLAAGVEDLMQKVSPRDAQMLGISLTQPAGLAERSWVLGASKDECQRLMKLDLPGELLARTGVAVHVHNDATSALWSEKAFGRLPEDTDCAYVFLSCFIGSALHVNGQVLVGKGAGAARIGAVMTAQPDGVVQALHFTTSLWALAGFLGERGFRVNSHEIDSWDWDAIEPAFAEWLDLAADSLALTFANTAAIVGLPMIFVDSIMPRPILGRLINAVQARIDSLPIDLFDPPIVMMGSNGAAAPAIGAAYRLFHERFFSAGDAFGQ